MLNQIFFKGHKINKKSGPHLHFQRFQLFKEINLALVLYLTFVFCFSLLLLAGAASKFLAQHAPKNDSAPLTLIFTLL
jgi:hypothetical protein